MTKGKQGDIRLSPTMALAAVVGLLKCTGMAGCMAIDFMMFGVRPKRAIGGAILVIVATLVVAFWRERKRKRQMSSLGDPDQ